MNYFIDANLVIDCFEKRKLDAISRLKPILKDDGSNIFTNRLVYLESLRSISIEKQRIYKTVKDAFLLFDFVDINQHIYNEAIELSRVCRQKGLSIKGRCAAIDYLHFITAKHYQLELLSHDNDMEKLTATYDDWKKI